MRSVIQLERLKMFQTLIDGRAKIDAHDRQEILARGLDALWAEYPGEAAALCLRYFRGKTAAEIAEEMGLPGEGQVRRLITHGREHLEKYLPPREDIP